MNSAGASDPPDARQAASGDGASAPDLAALARDWITLWQSELAAMIIDREAQETAQTLLALWAGALASVIQAMPREASYPGWPQAAAGRERDRGASAAHAPWPAPAASPSDPRDAEIERLHCRLAALEQRLAELAPAPEAKPRSRPPRRGKRRS